MNCEKCGLSKERCPTYYPLTSQYDALIVGQAPGKTEVVTRQPFTGSAGKMLFSLCKQAGLVKRELAQANLIQCKPPDDGRGNDRVPTALEVECCASQLKEAIWRVQPQLIIALGSCAAIHLTGKGPVSQIHGAFYTLLPSFEWNCDVLCCFHPSFVMRQRQMIPVAVIDLQKVNSYFITGQPPNVSEETNFIIDPSDKELSDYLYSCKETVAFDTETTSLNVRQAQILGVSLSELGSKTAVAIYLTANDSRWRILKDWFEDRRFAKATQNGPYDLAVLETAGVKLQNWAFDTMLAEQMLNSDGRKDLNYLRSLYTNVAPYKPLKREMKEIASWGKDRMLLYAAKDALVTQLVMQAQLPLLSTEQKKLLSNLLLPVSQALNNVERKGIHVYVNKLALLYAARVPRMNELREYFNKKYGINPDSPSQVANTFGLPDARRHTIFEEAQRSGENAEDLNLLMNYKDLTKGGSTFLLGVYTRLEGEHIHSHYKIEGTGTGRLSSVNPNLQNIPKAFRCVYIADDPKTEVLIAADYKQLELRVAAALSQDEVMIDDLAKGMDLHSIVSELITPFIPEDKKSLAQGIGRGAADIRVIAKAVVFGTLYGRSAASLAKAFNVPSYMAKQWQELCFSRYPRLEKWIECRRDDARTRGFVTTPFGRKRYVQTQMQAINTPIQSSANDVALGSLLLADRAGLDVRLTTHDELVILTKRRSTKKEARQLIEIMTRPIPELGNLRFPVDVKIGDDWYEMKEVKL